jgi:hypothetical protein
LTAYSSSSWTSPPFSTSVSNLAELVVLELARRAGAAVLDLELGLELPDRCGAMASQLERRGAWRRARPGGRGARRRRGCWLAPKS